MENSIRYTDNKKNGKGNYVQNAPTSFVAQQVDEMLSAEFGTPDADIQAFYGIDERGIWKQAHAIARQFGVEPQDAFNEIVVQALEATVKNPDITEKGPAYLLVAASNNTRNTFSKLYHTYQEQHGKTTVSYDVAMEGDADTDNLNYADTLTQMTFTYDYETAVTVKDIIAGLDDTGKQVAAFLQDGYRASEISRMTGMYPMQVSRTIKGIRQQMEAALL